MKEGGQRLLTLLHSLRDARPRPVSNESREIALTRGDGQTVLVVEDEALVREFSVSVLEEAGYRVLAAPDGPIALDLLITHRDEEAFRFTDVVLTEPMNGRELADAALQIRPGLPVLFSTGYTRNAIIHHGRLDEGVTLITKRFTPRDLALKVGEMPSHPAAEPRPAIESTFRDTRIGEILKLPVMSRLRPRGPIGLHASGDPPRSTTLQKRRSRLRSRASACHDRGSQAAAQAVASQLPARSLA